MMEALFPLGWAHYLAGGLLIGLGVSWLFASTGLIGGMSSVYSALWSWVDRSAFFQQPRFTGSRVWRVVYAAGLVLGALIWWLAAGRPEPPAALPLWQLLAGGFIAGFGARLSNGCTSGHGICGMASLQLPSVAAVIIFLATGMLTAQVIKTLGGA